MKFNTVIIGDSVGGCAAAIAALEAGQKVALLSFYPWIGGQLTSQSVPPDEHPWIEQTGGTARYRTYRQRVRQFYRHNYPLTAQAKATANFNPGTAFVSAISHEPQVSWHVLTSWLQPYISGGQLTLYRQVQLQSAEIDQDTIRCLNFTAEGASHSLIAPFFIDATETGEVLPLVEAEHVIGAEAQSDTQEPHALSKADPLNQQAISWCFAISYHPEEDHTIKKPEQYEFWRDYHPPMTPEWPAPFLSWTATHPITLDPVLRSFHPINPQPERGPMDLWTFRRIADQKNFNQGTYNSDIVLVNWPQIDYTLGPIIGVSESEKEKHLEGARQQSLSLFYWMQTEAPREDGQVGWPGLRLRPDITGTQDGLAQAPYIRESRRIKALFTVREQHVATEYRKTVTPADEPVTAQQFEDSVGIGAYRIDLHPSTNQRNYLDVSALPFQIPLGSMIPVRLKNLIPGCKNIGTTHITNGCYRLHPVEWNIGEVAGLMSVYCQKNDYALHQLPQKTEDFQKLLTSVGIPLSWNQHEAL